MSAAEIFLLFCNAALFAAVFVVRGWTKGAERQSLSVSVALVVLVKARELWRRQEKGFDVEPEWKRFSDRLENPDWIDREAARIVADMRAGKR